jgi:hypothetical protein
MRLMGTGEKNRRRKRGEEEPALRTLSEGDGYISVFHDFEDEEQVHYHISFFFLHTFLSTRFERYSYFPHFPVRYHTRIVIFNSWKTIYFPYRQEFLCTPWSLLRHLDLYLDCYSTLGNHLHHKWSCCGVIVLLL